MNEIQATNVAVANEIIEQLFKDKPFNLKLDAGQTCALYNIATESHHLHSNVVKGLTVSTWQRVRNGTGIILEINDSNADVIYHMLSSYIAKHELPESVVKSLEEVP
ncbi:hypothetical protein [Acinetobacter sp. HR7]|uniref:hypothetical protein n=1 Tax=Acinetobacter sp. HR7 TaxID=1509403 RepID=UPI0005382E87|nr:hypothetical protein [Acinetobacter sp. HR7]KGT48409.1 hypothetical protein GW12_05600 [Acinetobacter sp. HR7]